MQPHKHSHALSSSTTLCGVFHVRVLSWEVVLHSSPAVMFFTVNTLGIACMVCIQFKTVSSKSACITLKVYRLISLSFKTPKHTERGADGRRTGKLAALAFYRKNKSGPNFNLAFFFFGVKFKSIKVQLFNTNAFKFVPCSKIQMK